MIKPEEADIQFSALWIKLLLIAGIGLVVMKHRGMKKVKADGTHS